MAYKRGKTWWFSVTVDGKQVFESARTSNKRLAEKRQAQRKAEVFEGRFRLLKKTSPTLADFAEQFITAVKHPKTRARYSSSADNLTRFFKDATVAQAHRARSPQERLSF